LPLIHSSASPQSLVVMLKWVPPCRIVGGIFTTFIQLAFTGSATGIVSNIMITATKVNLAIELREFLECFLRTFDISNETPIAAIT